jgi:hypothetical protein
MSKELERRNVGAVSEAGRRMDEALAKLGLAQEKPGKSGRSGVSEIAEVPRVCAVFDKIYVSVYERGANGLFRYQRSFRVTDSGIPNGTNAVLQVVDVDPGGPPECCAWCGAPPQDLDGKQLTSVKCGGCQSFICLGKTENQFFRCRASCGCSGPLSKKWVSTEGAKHRTAPAQPMGGGMGSAEADVIQSKALVPRKAK